MTDKNDQPSIRTFVLNMLTEQVRSGDVSLNPEPIVAEILLNAETTALAVQFAVDSICTRDAGRLIRSRVIRDDVSKATRSGASTRFIASIVDYGLSLLDVRFGEKRLGDYLPSEALAYASQQHEAARKVGIQSRFVAGVARACHDAQKPIREQITEDSVDAIRRAIIDSSPNKEVAEIVLTVA